MQMAGPENTRIYHRYQYDYIGYSSVIMLHVMAQNRTRYLYKFCRFVTKDLNIIGIVLCNNFLIFFIVYILSSKIFQIQTTINNILFQLSCRV